MTWKRFSIDLFKTNKHSALKKSIINYKMCIRILGSTLFVHSFKKNKKNCVFTVIYYTYVCVCVHTFTTDIINTSKQQKRQSISINRKRTKEDGRVGRFVQFFSKGRIVGAPRRKRKTRKSFSFSRASFCTNFAPRK